ncbi:MAG: hypothetical protein R3A13_12185 [Bdellovibrionota bacterium]
MPCSGLLAQDLEQSDTATIRTITVKVRNIFSEKEESNLIYRTANNLKINTRQKVILTELLFKEGDPYSKFIIAESLRNLRNIRFLRDPKITPTFNGKFVDIEVNVQDTWTLIPQFSFSSGDGENKFAAGLAESNLAGTGKRLEALFSDDNDRQTVETVWEDPRLLNTKNKLLAAYLASSDGEQYIFSLGKPFRSLVEERSWITKFNDNDFVGKLFENSDEKFIFRQKQTNLGAAITFSDGDPEKSRKRYTVGYNYDDTRFSQANQNDYLDVGLDPDLVSNDPQFLAENRRFSGPTFTFQSIEPEYISMAYIDRFERVSDYNLGNTYSLTSQFAPEALGSREDTFLFGAQTSKGWLFNNSSFLRSELRGSSRAAGDDLDNSLLAAEIKWFNVLGSLFVGDHFLGKHTLAANFTIDYSDDLDQDRQFRAGGDNALRGYEAKTFNGDKRLVLNLEDRFHLVDNVFDLVSLGGAFFIDVGGASYDQYSDILQDQLYSNVGFGLRLGIPKSSGERTIRIDIAFPLRDGPDGSGEFEPRIIFSGGQLFSSRLRSEPSETETVAVGLDR